MDELPAEEIARISPLLRKDERRRRRDLFHYANDILAANSVVPFSIWPMPNVDARRVIIGQISAENLPYEEQNEVEKGMLFEDQQQFVAQNMPADQMLCEVLIYRPCLQERCPLFRTPNSIAGGRFGICEEFKIAFEKPQDTEKKASKSKGKAAR